MMQQESRFRFRKGPGSQTGRTVGTGASQYGKRGIYVESDNKKVKCQGVLWVYDDPLVSIRRRDCSPTLRTYSEDEEEAMANIEKFLKQQISERTVLL